MPGKYLDTELAFHGAIPDDLSAVGVQGVASAYYDPYEARDRQSGEPLDNNALLRYLLKNSDIDILLRTLGNAFFPRQVTVGVTPTVIVKPNRYPRGYIIINPNTTVSGVVTTVTAFPAGTVFPIGTTNSAAINVSGFGTLAAILNVTVGSVGPISVNHQTQDPISGNWATVQTDIFGFGAGAVAIGTYYANMGAIGVDQNSRFQVVVAGAPLTGSLAAFLKPALAGTIAGPTVFLGGQDVNTTLGYPLLSGAKETWYLRENTPLFGIAVAPTNLNIFELQ